MTPDRKQAAKALQMLREGYGAESGDQGDQLDLPLQRKDIAALLGATPESISRLISKLGDEGLVNSRADRRLSLPQQRRSVSDQRHLRSPRFARPMTQLRPSWKRAGALLSMIAAKEKASPGRALHQGATGQRQARCPARPNDRF